MPKMSKKTRYEKLVAASSKRRTFRFPLAEIEFCGVIKFEFDTRKSPSEKRIEVAQKLIPLVRRKYGITEHLVYGSAGFRASTDYSDLDIEAVAPKLKKKRDALLVVEHPRTGEKISVNLRLYPSLAHSRYATHKTAFPIIRKGQMRRLRPIDLLHTLDIDPALVHGHSLLARNWVANAQAVGFALERILWKHKTKSGFVVTPRMVTDSIFKHFLVKRESNKLAKRQPAIDQICKNVQDILHTMSPWTEPVRLQRETTANGFIGLPVRYNPDESYVIVNKNESLQPKSHRFYRVGSLTNYYLNSRKSWGFSKQIALWVSGVR